MSVGLGLNVFWSGWIKEYFGNAANNVSNLASDASASCCSLFGRDALRTVRTNLQSGPGLEATYCSSILDCETGKALVCTNVPPVCDR